MRKRVGRSPLAASRRQPGGIEPWRDELIVVGVLDGVEGMDEEIEREGAVVSDRLDGQIGGARELEKVAEEPRQVVVPGRHDGEREGVV